MLAEPVYVAVNRPALGSVGGGVSRKVEPRALLMLEAGGTGILPVHLLSHWQPAGAPATKQVPLLAA